MPPRERMKVVIIPDSDSGSEEPEVVMISDSDSGSVEPEISFARPASHPVRPIPPLLPRPPPALALASVSQSNYVPFGEHMNVVRDRNRKTDALFQLIPALVNMQTAIDQDLAPVHELMDSEAILDRVTRFIVAFRRQIDPLINEHQQFLEPVHEIELSDSAAHRRRPTASRAQDDLDAVKGAA